MVVSRIINRAVLLQASKSVVQVQKRHAWCSKYDHPLMHEPYTTIGYNMPWVRQHRYLILLRMIIYVASGWWLPYISYCVLRAKARR